MSRSASKAGRAGAFSVRGTKSPPLALTLRRIRQQRDQVVIPIGLPSALSPRRWSGSFQFPALLPAQLGLGRRPQSFRLSLASSRDGSS